VRVASLEGATQVYVPLTLRRDLPRMDHDFVRAGHPGATGMYASIRRHSSWESVAADMYGWVASCASFAGNRIAPRRHTALMKLLLATELLASLSMDLLGPLTETKTGRLLLQIISHQVLKLVLAVSLAGNTATDASSAFSPDWNYVNGLLDTVQTDNGPQFASLFFESVCGFVGIRKLYSTTNYLQTDGQVSRIEETLVDMFMHYIEYYEDIWDERLAALVLAYNSQPHPTTCLAPMYQVTPRHWRNCSLERMPDGMTPDPSQFVAEEKIAFLDGSRPGCPSSEVLSPRREPCKSVTTTTIYALDGCRCPTVTGLTCTNTPGRIRSTRC